MHMCRTSANDPFVLTVINVLVCPASTLLVSTASQLSFMIHEQVSHMHEPKAVIPMYTASGKLALFGTALQSFQQPAVISFHSMHTC